MNGDKTVGRWRSDRADAARSRILVRSKGPQYRFVDLLKAVHTKLVCALKTTCRDWEGRRMSDGVKAVKARANNQETSKDYSVAVVATMSAGKSTLLNAMIGQRLLPSRNEACTATMFRVVDHDDSRCFHARRKVADTWSDWSDDVTQELLNEWNSTSPQEILVEGNLPNIDNTKNLFRVAFVDTPGPNNSSCKAHAEVTERIISESGFSAVLFVINASVAGVEDEERLLAQLKSMFDVSQKKAKIYFIVNKIDLLDPGQGESVVRVLGGCARQLRSIGFKNPLLIPTSGDIALQLRHIINTAIPYETGAGKPRLSRAKRDGVYEAVGSPRALARLRGSVEMLLSAKQSYRDGLKFSKAAKDTLVRIDHSAKNRKSRIKSLWLAGKFFSGSELRAAIKLTGVPVLEYILESELNRYSKVGGAK